MKNVYPIEKSWWNSRSEIQWIFGLILGALGDRALDLRIRRPLRYAVLRLFHM